jgi:hypothetical protein
MKKLALVILFFVSSVQAMQLVYIAPKYTTVSQILRSTGLVNNNKNIVKLLNANEKHPRLLSKIHKGSRLNFPFIPSPNFNWNYQISGGEIRIHRLFADNQRVLPPNVKDIKRENLFYDELPFAKQSMNLAVNTSFAYLDVREKQTGNEISIASQMGKGIKFSGYIYDKNDSLVNVNISFQSYKFDKPADRFAARFSFNTYIAEVDYEKKVAENFFLMVGIRYSQDYSLYARSTLDLGFETFNALSPTLGLYYYIGFHQHSFKFLGLLSYRPDKTLEHAKIESSYGAMVELSYFYQIRRNRYYNFFVSHRMDSVESVEIDQDRQHFNAGVGYTIKLR